MWASKKNPLSNWSDEHDSGSSSRDSSGERPDPAEPGQSELDDAKTVSTRSGGGNSSGKRGKQQSVAGSASDGSRNVTFDEKVSLCPLRNSCCLSYNSEIHTHKINK